MNRQVLALEQKVLRAYKQLPLKPRRIVLAVSGGVDSMVMAEILWKWRKGLRLESMKVAHVHHGPAETRAQTAFRARARKFVAKWAGERELEFLTNEEAPACLLRSEEEWRAWREQWFSLWKGPFALAHHQDDLLETRLIRLIRGSGVQGLRAMRTFAGGRWRPLLHVSQSEIRDYARARGLQWVEDPSNAKTEPLRNWLRREWLPMLEAKRPGALGAMARSLESMAQDESAADEVKFTAELANYVGLRRDFLSSCSVSERRTVLARYLKALGLRGYSQNHVDEIIKRLKRHQGSEFEMLGLVFKISHDLLSASRV